MNKPILDACCGSRIFWFNPNNPDVIFCDNRRLETQAIWKSGNGKSVRYCTVAPDVLADFRDLPFPSESFWHVVFDPPHLNNVGDNAWMAKKYGKLPKDWRPLIHDGFHECWRVLKPNGTLIFKWNEDQIPVRDVIAAIGVLPLYGHKSGRASKTHWMAFVKTTLAAKNFAERDVRIRMLKPSELAAAHSFPKDYKLSGTRADQVKQIGNSVPVRTAKAIVKAMFSK